MADKAKAITLILVLVIVVSLGLAGMSLLSLQKEQAKSAGLQEELSEVKVRLKSTESELEKTKKNSLALEAKLKETTDQIDALSKELIAEKTSKEEALAQAQRAKADLELQKKLRSDLETKFSQAQIEGKKFQGQLAELEAKKSELEQKIKELEGKSGSGVELGKIVVASEGQDMVPASVAKPAAKDKKSEVKKDKKNKKEIKAAPAPAPVAAAALEGKVLVINKEYNFVVINLGSKEGVKVDDVFSVLQSGNSIGDVKVEKVHETMAAAGFVDENMKDKVKEGDKVVPKK